MKRLQIFCDGGARGNPGPAAIGVYIQDQNQQPVFSISRPIGETTNNVAEYKALIAALKWLQANLDRIPARIEIFMDSKLAVNQLNGIFKIKNKNLKRLNDIVRRLQKNITVYKQLKDKQQAGESFAIVYQYIPRQSNQKADALVNKALDNKLQH
jgi:ribonuclease HI